MTTTIKKTRRLTEGTAAICRDTGRFWVETMDAEGARRLVKIFNYTGVAEMRTARTAAQRCLRNLR